MKSAKVRSVLRKYVQKDNETTDNRQQGNRVALKRLKRYKVKSEEGRKRDNESTES
jgi:hypothetical protein